MDKKQTKKDPVSEHFSELGKKSWEARKKKLLKRIKSKKVARKENAKKARDYRRSKVGVKIN